MRRSTPVPASSRDRSRLYPCPGLEPGPVQTPTVERSRLRAGTSAKPYQAALPVEPFRPLRRLMRESCDLDSNLNGPGALSFCARTGCRTRIRGTHRVELSPHELSP